MEMKEREINTIEEFKARYFPKMTEEDKLIMEFLHRHPRRRQEILSDAKLEKEMSKRYRFNFVATVDSI
jgi:hypothetical protein